MRFAALDTNALIWGLKGEHTAGQQDMLKRARFALAEIEADKLQIIIPTIALAELAVTMTEKKAAEFIAEAEERFVIAPFDSRSAEVATRLWRTHSNVAEHDRIPRRQLKVDVLIIASAFCAGTRRFYTHDKNCRKLAATLMDARDLPEMGQTLYDDAPGRS
ncbi:MAG: PIN domain-containing protein [Phycisphaerales bacterium]|nr:PIN domain-containing protein [Phycisphaerales bacterium]